MEESKFIKFEKPDNVEDYSDHLKDLVKNSEWYFSTDRGIKVLKEQGTGNVKCNVFSIDECNGRIQFVVQQTSNEHRKEYCVDEIHHVIIEPSGDWTSTSLHSRMHGFNKYFHKKDEVRRIGLRVVKE